MRISAGAAALRRRLNPDPNALTQARIAEACGVSQAAVSAWVRGVSKPEGDERRAQLEELSGVPASSWDDEADSDESGERLAVPRPA